MIFSLSLLPLSFSLTLSSVERISEMLKAPQEKQHTIAATQPPASWPERGLIEFKDIQMCYVPNVPVLHDFSCTVLPTEKVGIAGRSGAGKSTLSLALFRMMEPTKGELLVDGRDVLQMGLHDLRSRLRFVTVLISVLTSINHIVYYW